ncbi:efflux RND transporter permease subunit [Bradyrhizobium sp. CB1650]|uniref:efflux RND transporter permease subunit n=1 Tax=Bradyrhizobium sp. CB1650 TaxID=3039153 RepID=UPI00243561F8|nr:efflux RND transporter permease subunit [Bradyrhizobium sp. CB1650]WGD50172.1 efflux RND transporter permease subunit [Bradyrhizobium sp. CB1650]
MIAIVRLALARPYTFVVMAVLILIFGTTAALRTPTDIFPNIDIPVISVVFSYTGLPADDMAGRIVTFYERSLPNSVNDIEHIESQSIVNYGIIKIFFQPTVNINAALAQVNGMSQTVLKQMPPGITPPLILSFNASSVPILQLALSSPQMSETQVYDSALNFIRPALAPVPGATLPLPFGGKVRQVQADLNQRALHQYGVSANDVINALSLQNLITPVGTQKIGSYEYTVNLNDSPKAIEAFNNLPIKTVNGTVIYMHDVAYVHDGNPPQTNAVRVNGASAVLLTVMKAGVSSTLDIINNVKALLPSISNTLPSSLKLTPAGDQSVYVTDAVSSVVKEGVIAAVLTGMMILLFLGSWRSTLIITLSIPLAILAALTGLSVLGETINVMTLGGLALAVGILVDDATVTIENINWHMEQGKAIEPAILDGARQIVVPATVSLLCICIAFVPMFGLGGVAGYLFRPLAEAVILALAASYVLSRTLVPTMANYLLRNQQIHHGGEGADAAPSRNPFAPFHRGFERMFDGIRAHYRGLLQLCLANRVKVIAGFLIVSVLSFGLAPYLGQDFFPTVDAGQIKLHIRAPTGTRIEQTVSLSDKISAEIQKIIPKNEIGGIVSNVGLSVSGINMAYNNSGTIGVGDADILISLNPNHAPTDDYIKTMREKLPQQFPGTSFAFLPADIVSQVLNFGVPAPIDVQVAGRDLAANRKYANALLTRIKSIPGIVDARIQQAFQQPTLDVNVDRSMASLAGVSEKDVATAMLTTLSGSSQSSPTYWLDPKNGVSYAVSIQTPQRDIDSMTGLKNIPVTSTTGANTQLLGGIAEVARSRSNAVVSHYNVSPVIDIYATPQGRDLGALATDIQKSINATAKDLPKGASVALRGQVSTMTSAYQQLFVGLAAAIALIYLLMVINFQSWLDPFVIIMALPTALAGIVWMLFGTGTTLSVPALTGAIMCMGVATANSILVISFARERMAEGASAFEAAFDAGSSRFRPVLMTALAMVIGMLPMALEPGQNTPLGRAVIGGLVFATCATLFLVPTIFSLVHGGHRSAAPEANSTH